MNIARLGGVVVGALLAVPLLSPLAANAAVQTPAAVAPVSYAADCGYTHWWDGHWHHGVRWICDGGYDNGGGYYGGGNHDRGGHSDRGGHDGGHAGGDHRH